MIQPIHLAPPDSPVVIPEAFISAPPIELEDRLCEHCGHTQGEHKYYVQTTDGDDEVPERYECRFGWYGPNAGRVECCYCTAYWGDWLDPEEPEVKS